MKLRIFNQGFTLVELLIVISIIGILSALVYPNFNDARVDARNKALQVEMKELQLAIELFKAQNGVYPPAPVVLAGPPPDGISLGDDCAVSNDVFGVITNYSYSKGPAVGSLSGDGCGNNNPYIGDSSIDARFVPDFFAELPDPADSARPDECFFEYQVNEDQSGYKFTAINCHGGDTPMTQASELARCPASCSADNDCDSGDSDFGSTYAIYSMWGACQDSNPNL